MLAAESDRSAGATMCAYFLLMLVAVGAPLSPLSCFKEYARDLCSGLAARSSALCLDARPLSRCLPCAKIVSDRPARRSIFASKLPQRSPKSVSWTQKAALFTQGEPTLSNIENAGRKI